MTSKKSCLTTLVMTMALWLGGCAQEEIKPPDARALFIQRMVTRHQFKSEDLEQLLNAAQTKPEIIKRISSPAEAMPWYKYRKIFLTEQRIREGVQFWRANEQALKAAEAKYGVPPEIITAIIGVESQYGQHPGKHRVIDALVTLGFDYPKRSAFFLDELENFLLLCRDEKINPLEPTGSYAGAMGMPQFMPSSFRNFAADYDQDGRRDIWHKPGDVSFSVANYFAEHGWQKGEPIAYPATTEDESYKQIINKELKPDLTVHDLETLKITLPTPLSPDSKVKILAFEQETGHYLVASLNNFFVITRYNHSPLYALAVFQLSQAISNQKISSPYE